MNSPKQELGTCDKWSTPHPQFSHVIGDICPNWRPVSPPERPTPPEVQAEFNAGAENWPWLKPIAGESHPAGPRCQKCGKPMAERQVRCVYCDTYTPLPAGPTPGPWTYYLDTCEKCREDGETEFIIDGPPGALHGQFSHEPDARLIAAAPELLEAAELTWQHFHRNQLSGNFQGDDEHEAWTALHKAIAKARGNQ